jgi:hypothetical protein
VAGAPACRVLDHAPVRRVAGTRRPAARPLWRQQQASGCLATCAAPLPAVKKGSATGELRAPMHQLCRDKTLAHLSQPLGAVLPSHRAPPPFPARHARCSAHPDGGRHNTLPDARARVLAAVVAVVCEAEQRGSWFRRQSLFGRSDSSGCFPGLLRGCILIQRASAELLALTHCDGEGPLLVTECQRVTRRALRGWHAPRCSARRAGRQECGVPPPWAAQRRGKLFTSCGTRARR